MFIAINDKKVIYNFFILLLSFQFIINSFKTLVNTSTQNTDFDMKSIQNLKTTIKVSLV